MEGVLQTGPTPSSLFVTDTFKIDIMDKTGKIIFLIDDEITGTLDFTKYLLHPIYIFENIIL